MADQIIRCVLSGSYHKDMPGLRRAYKELVTCGCQVLSPHRLDFDSDQELFVRDDAEQGMSEVELENHHLLSIKQSNFLWIHAPEGYIGSSTALEIGFALAVKIPIFSSTMPSDVTLRHFVYGVTSVFSAIEQLNSKTE